MKNLKCDIILYGLVDDEREKLLCNHTIIGYSDSYAEIDSFKGKPFYSKSQLADIKFDYLLIMANRETAIGIREDISKYVDRNKVIIFQDNYNGLYSQKVDRVLQNNCKPRGIILGISHAVTGISKIEDFVNLAVRSQDIFYNIKTFGYYMEHIDLSLDTLIFELYDYNYLNFDVSRTRRAVENYYTQGGLWKEEHNFSINNFYDMPLSEIMIEKMGVNCIKDPFVAMTGFQNYCGFDSASYTNVVSSDAALPSRKFVSGLVQKRYEDTILENKMLLENFCSMIRSKFPNTSIYFLFMPRFITMEIALKPHLQKWKEEIYFTLLNLKEKYEINILDFKEFVSISGNNRFYNDVNHLNSTGAAAFTDILFECIQQNKSIIAK